MPYTLLPTWGGKYNGVLQAPDDYDRSVLRIHDVTPEWMPEYNNFKTRDCMPIEAHELPSKVIYKGNNLPDWCSIHDVPHVEVINTRFKELIEELEPDVHQFFPVQIVRRDGTVVSDDYHFFNVRQLAYTIDVDSSPRAHWEKGSDGFGNLGKIHLNPTDPVPAVVYFADRVGKMHIWQERYRAEKWGQFWLLNVTGFTVSDTMMKRMKQEKIYKPRITFWGVMDTEWNKDVDVYNFS